MSIKYIFYSFMLLTVVLTSYACSTPEQATPNQQNASTTESPTNDSRYQEAVSLYEANKLEEAKTAFEECIAQDSTNGMYDFYIGNILRKQNDNVKAMEYFNSAIKKSPDIIEAYNNLTALQMAIQDFEAALETANSGLSQVADFDDLKFKKAQVLYVMKQFEQSNELLLEVVQNNAYYDAHRFLGLNYINLNDIAKAKEHLNKFLELAPDGVETKEKVKQIVDQLK